MRNVREISMKVTITLEAEPEEILKLLDKKKKLRENKKNGTQAEAEEKQKIAEDIAKLLEEIEGL